MPSDLPKLYLARHGDTAWTDSHQVVAGLRRAAFTERRAWTCASGATAK